MTIQASDQVEFNNQTFSLTGINGSGLFTPYSVDIEAVGYSTALRRGYRSKFLIEDNKLFINELYINIWSEIVTEVGVGPEIFGIMPQSHEIDGKKTNTFTYADMKAPVSFSGNLLIGKDFINDDNMWYGIFRVAWEFKEIYDLSFQEGMLTSVRNVSKEFHELKKIVDENILSDLYDEKIETNDMAIQSWIDSDYGAPWRYYSKQSLNYLLKQRGLK